MSNSLCKSSVFKAYQEVITDVIQNVREQFLEDGLDETILQELKSLWETKLAATKAVEEVKEVDKIIAANKTQKMSQQNQQTFLNQLAQQQNPANQIVGQVPPNNHIPQGIAFPEWRRVPVKLTIPSPPGCTTTEKRVLGIEVPEVFLQDHHLKSILTGPIISATLNLPIDAATTFLQDQVNNAFLKHQQSTNFVNINMGINPSLIQTDGAASCSLKTRKTQEVRGQHRIRKKLVASTSVSTDEKVPYQSTTQTPKIFQSDGARDSSDDEDLDDEEDEDDNDNDILDDIEEEAQEAAEDEPLNSEDDVSDADGTEESFNTDNVIVCQFDKITRAKNRWKFHLNDGIMNLNGEDYVFQKANGEAEW
ncbi:transcription initiation factor IIA subunit 1-like [Sitophilus oryzae]|uniref:Transcription initiation factor IIA subunit 1-like n=1 Tax=Sitophilus oryzae TaxID=7048 RepID=A0A6J2XY00_SITOR|nr:transcription initiation factor IIA subunit 1-like [Sitophilus oryzae]